jgi:hypothetical protein
MSELTDQQFFTMYPARRSRIRAPVRQLYTNRQRAVQFADEEEVAFRSLGDHQKDRRRILIYRVPEQNPLFAMLSKKMGDVPLLKIPFLLHADETVENRDDILLPIIDELMRDAAQK